MSPKGFSPKLASYMLWQEGSHSELNTHSPPALSKAIRMPPIPANKSINFGFVTKSSSAPSKKTELVGKLTVNRFYHGQMLFKHCGFLFQTQKSKIAKKTKPQRVLNPPASFVESS